MQYLKSGPVQDPVIYTQSEVDGLLAAGLATKQNTLVSGTNVKTVGGAQVVGQGDVALKTVSGQSIVGSGNISVAATSGATLDELEALIYAGL